MMLIKETKVCLRCGRTSAHGFYWEEMPVGCLLTFRLERELYFKKYPVCNWCCVPYYKEKR